MVYKRMVSFAADRAEEKWLLINTRGAATSAHSQPVTSLPDYADPATIRRFQLFARQHIVSTYTCAASGLWMLLQVPEIFVPLVATRKSESLPCLFMRQVINVKPHPRDLLSLFIIISRYSSTLDTVLKWIETDMFDNKSEGRVAVEKVRCRHNNVCKLMETLAKENDHLKPKEGTVWVSQKDMVVTQFAFIGLTLLYPEACGIRDGELNLHDAILFWHFIGYLMGIPEEFNLLSGTQDEAMELCKIVMKEIYIPILDQTVEADKTLVQKSQGMAVDTVTATSAFLPVMTGRLVHKYWADVIGCETNIVLNFTEKIRYRVVSSSVQSLLPISWIRKLATRIWFANNRRVMKNRRCIFEKYQNQDPGVKYKLCDLQNIK